MKNKLENIKKNLATSYITHQAETEPFLEHHDGKCGQCLKNQIRHDVAKEFLLQGKVSVDFITAYEAEVKRRWENTYLFKEIQKLKNQGLTLDEAIKEMENRGYIP